MTHRAPTMQPPRATGKVFDLLVFLLSAGSLGLLYWLHQTRLPDGRMFGPEWSGAFLLPWAAKWVLQRPRIARFLGDGVARGDGVWVTSWAERGEALLIALVLIGLFVRAAAPLPPVLIQKSDHLGLGLWVASCAGFGVLLMAGWRRLRCEVVLRIDRYGVYSRKWKGALPWSAIDRIILVGAENHPKRSGDAQALLLSVGANQLPGVKERTRREGGVLELELAPAGLRPRDALKAILAQRPQFAPS